MHGASYNVANLLSTGQYDARYRISLRKLCDVLSIQWERFLATEDGLAIFLRKEIDLEKCTSAIMESESNGRWWKIGIGAGMDSFSCFLVPILT